MGRIGRDHLARHEPVKQHADRGEVLLDGRLLEFFPQASDIGCYMHRFDVGQLGDVVTPIAPRVAGFGARSATILMAPADFKEARIQNAAGHYAQDPIVQ